MSGFDILGQEEIRPTYPLGRGLYVRVERRAGPVVRIVVSQTARLLVQTFSSESPDPIIGRHSGGPSGLTVD